MTHDICPQRKPRIEWMWKSNKDPWSSEPAEWSPYSDVETAIIEEAYNANMLGAILDDYRIDFKHQIQISNHDIKNQRPVKRTISEGTDMKLRPERFMPNPISIVKSFQTVRDRSNFCMEACEHFNISPYWDFDCDIRQANTRRILVEKAAEGLIIEGKLIGQKRQGEWLAGELLNVKEGTELEVYNCCARLYCMESFLYKKLNECMRLVGDGNAEYEVLWRSKVVTFGPFALLLHLVPLSDETNRPRFLYRGAQLTDDQIEQYRRMCVDGSIIGAAKYFMSTILFPAFTSTSRNREKAERYGNVLFIIDDNRPHIGFWCSCNLESYSMYDEEEEILLPWRENLNHFVATSCTFNAAKEKWEICLRYVARSP